MSYNKVSCNKTCITNTTCIYYKILMYCLKSTFIAKSGINKEFRKYFRKEGSTFSVVGCFLKSGSSWRVRATATEGKEAMKKGFLGY